jgi:hypothetical protein
VVICREGVKMNIEITDETGDLIALTVLKDTYKYLNEDIEVLTNTEKLEPHEHEDLEDFIKYRNAMYDVIEYYGGFSND